MFEDVYLLISTHESPEDIPDPSSVYWMPGFWFSGAPDMQRVAVNFTELVIARHVALYSDSHALMLQEVEVYALGE